MFRGLALKRGWRTAVQNTTGRRHVLRSSPSFVWGTFRNSYGNAVRSFGSTDFSKVRNIGISAHIDSGKTTLTERILFYTGRINEIHEVRGKDGVGAKMDSMELEREKGITIASAATYTTWGDTHINIIDTPGHVDFTIEVERALRVLDGAVLVLCSVSGVQSQSITVDRQMKRYNVPRVAFINKCDRQGANPWKVVNDLRTKLALNAAAVQYPIGLEDKLEGVIDLIAMKAFTHEGPDGEVVIEQDIPANLLEKAEEAREELIEKVAEVDEELEELYIMEETPTEEQLIAAIRRATIGLKLCPVFMGSAFKNRGVQKLLDGVQNFLPDPTEVENVALDRSNNEAPVILKTAEDEPLVALAFKLEESRFGQLTYLRVYQGTFQKGGTIVNTSDGKKMKVPRTVRMHSNEMEDVDKVGPGEICAMFGVECNTGDTFCEAGTSLAMTSMFVPKPVISLAVRPTSTKNSANFSKALQRFRREDPTFRVHNDPESNETIISGMGELHLEIYVERMNREYNCPVETGKPQVAYREAISKRAEFNYLHKKQTGGSGQFGKVIGYIEPLEEDSTETFEFVNEMIGNNIPPEYISSIEKGFEEAMANGPLIGYQVQGVRVVLQDGAAHAVDSSEMAFKIASKYAFREAVADARAQILEPTMNVQVEAPMEFQGAVVAGLNRRKGLIQNNEAEGAYVTVEADVPLSEMFGYSTDLRSATQGKGEFSMEYKTHAPVNKSQQAELMKTYQESRK
jgi:elongation factor G